MGKFGCDCGNVISDSMSPCPHAGELHWEPEKDAIGNEFAKNVDEFLASARHGDRDSWIKAFFGEGYPLTGKDSEVIYDIQGRAGDRFGRAVLRCVECNRIYIQKEAYVNEWTCYEPRD